MKYFLIFVFLFCQSAFAANGSGNVSTVIQFGAGANNAVPSIVVPVSDITSTVSIVASASGTNGNFYQFVLMGPNNGQYQVPSTQSLHIVSMDFVSDTINCPAGVIGYAGSAFTNDVSITSMPPGLKYYGIIDTKPLKAGPTADVHTTVPFPALFGPNAFPFYENKQGGCDFSLVLTGYLTTP